MGRSGYSDDVDYSSWSSICWRGAVASAIRGKRGQAFLREMLAALDALPEKRLIDEDLERSDGTVCALGSVGKARGLDMNNLDPYDRVTVAKTFGIAEALAAELMYENDGCSWYNYEIPEHRFIRMQTWVAGKIKD